MTIAAVFLDRDGTINEEVGYLRDVGQLRILDGAVRGIALLRQQNLKVIVATNQAAVARGYVSELQLQRIHRQLGRSLRAAGAGLDGIYYCPHHPSEGQPPYRSDCSCRKPKPGMLQRAAQDWNVQLTRSFVVGDKITDLAAGLAVGCRLILVRTGYGRQAEREFAHQDFQPDFVAQDLWEASRWIVTQAR